MLTDQYLYCNNGVYANNTLTFDIPKLTNERVPNVGICLVQSTINIKKGEIYHRGIIVKLQNPSLNYLSTDNKGSVLGMYQKGPTDTTTTPDTDVHDLKIPSENITQLISPNQSQIILSFEGPSGVNITATDWVAGAFLFKLYYPDQDQVVNQYSREIAKVRL